MARILTSPLLRGLVVESPHRTLREHVAPYGLETTWADVVPDTDALIRALQETRAHVLFKRSRITVSRRVLEACPDLHAIQLCCIGDDSIDTVATADHGVLVFNDPVSNARSVVELAVGHLISLSRRLYETNASTHQHGFEKSDKERFEIEGKVIGILGLGNIGRQVARAVEALGMQVRFFDSRPVAMEVGQEMGWKRAESMADLFRTCDYITCHTSAKDAWGKDNEGLLNEVLALLGADRPTESPRIFLNLARGNLYSSDALNAAVESGAIRRAAVDVYPEEPRPGSTWENPYAAQERIVCTPHIGAATQEAQPRIAARVARTLGQFSRFGMLRDCVYSPRAVMAAPPPQPGNAVLAVVHSTQRGTKKAVSDAIFEAGTSTLSSMHEDFPNGIAYDLSVLDRPLSDAALADLVSQASKTVGDPDAIRSIRQVVVQADW